MILLRPSSVLLLSGLSLSGLAPGQTELQRWYGSAGVAGEGRSVACAGDIDGDGVADVITGAYFDLSGWGRVSIYSGADGSLIRQYTGDAYGDYFGHSVDGVGDVNADGRDDVIVGAPLDDDNGNDCGMARVYSGLTGAPLYTFYGAAAGDNLGYAARGAGDVNGDGRADLIVGAHNTENGPTFNAGTVFVYSGLNGGVLHTFLGQATSDFFGLAVDGVGDFNGDGLDDVVVGVPGSDVGGSGGGSSYVYSGANGALLYQTHGAAGDQLGWAVGRAGDVNGDGRGDVVVGAHQYTSGVGYARVISSTGGVLFTLTGDALKDSFGKAVRSAGDVNADGRADVIVGAPRDGAAPGYARVFSGLDGSALYTLTTGSNLSDACGHAVGTAGDVNGDGYDDPLVGAPGFDHTDWDMGATLVFSGVEIIGTTYCSPAVVNSSGAPAVISASGSATVADDDFHLLAEDLPVNQFGYFLTSQTQGFVQSPGGSQGNLCLGGEIARLTTQIQNSGAGGSFGITVDLSAIPTSPPHAIAPGETWNFQAWFRDLNPGQTSNFTDGLSVLFD